jgi:hypothetical protein
MHTRSRHAAELVVSDMATLSLGGTVTKTTKKEI